MYLTSRPATRQTRDICKSDVQADRLPKAFCYLAQKVSLAGSRSSRIYPPPPSEIEKPP